MNTLGDIVTMMEQQKNRSKDIIDECISGLGLYAAQIARENPGSPKIAQLRNMVETLVSYWGLDGYYDRVRPLRDFIDAFDSRVNAAITGADTTSDTEQIGAITLYGLFRHGERMIEEQGDAAKHDIHRVSALMKEIASAWGLETYTLRSLTGKLDTEAGRMGETIWHDSPELPGQSVSGRSVYGYSLKHAIQFEDNHSFAIGYSRHKEKPFIVTQSENAAKIRSYREGNLHGTLEAAKDDYILRVAEYMTKYGIKEKPSVMGQIKAARNIRHQQANRKPVRDADRISPGL